MKGPRMLALSEMTTPDQISMQEDYDDMDDDNGGNDSEESEKKRNKPYSSYIVRQKKEP